MSGLFGEMLDFSSGVARLDASLATPYDEQFIVRKRNALQQQGISLLTIEVQPHDTNIH